MATTHEHSVHIGNVGRSVYLFAVTKIIICLHQTQKFFVNPRVPVPAGLLTALRPWRSRHGSPRWLSLLPSLLASLCEPTVSSGFLPLSAVPFSHGRGSHRDLTVLDITNAVLLCFFFFSAEHGISLLRKAICAMFFFSKVKGFDKVFWQI